MKKTVFVVFIIFLSSCVKDPKDISTNILFDVKVNSKPMSEAVFVADNSTKYTFEIAALDGVDIDNDKQVTITVSDGTVAQVSNPTSGSSQATLTILGGKGTFYYVAGRKAQPSAILSITLNGITQPFNYVIKPSEPDTLQLSIIPANPTVGTYIEAKAFLLKNNSELEIVSEGLRVDYQVAAINASDPIKPYDPVPNFAYSTYDAQVGTSTNKTIQTNGQKGTITVTAKYMKEDGTTLMDTRYVEYK